MAKQKEKKQTPVSRLMEYAGSFQYLAVASWVLAAVSAFVALVPFYFIWRLIKEVLRVAPDYGAAQNLSTYVHRVRLLFQVPYAYHSGRFLRL